MVIKRSARTVTGSIVLAIFAAGVLLPLATLAIWTVAGRWSWPNLLPESFTLRGLRELFFRKEELTALFVSSFVISAVVALLSVSIGVLTARALTLYSFKGKKLIAFLAFLPLLVPSTVFGMGIHGSFIRWGLSDTLAGVILAHLVYSLPYAMLLCSGAFEAVGTKYEEQARVLGAGTWRIFRQVTLPLVAPILPPALGIAYIISFSHYFLTLLIGGGSVKTFSIVMVPHLQHGDRTIASCYSFVFLGATAALFIIADKFSSRAAHSEDTSFYQ